MFLPQRLKLFGSFSGTKGSYVIDPMFGNTSGNKAIAPPLTRSTNNGELQAYTRFAPKWAVGRGNHPGYPKLMPQANRKVGVDKNLQERLDDMFYDEIKVTQNRVNIGFPAINVETPANNRAKLIEFRREQRKNKELEKAARNRTLEVTLDQVKSEMFSIGGNLAEISVSADLYGIFEDLYGEEKFFNPIVNLDVRFDANDDYFIPVYRGNVILPTESSKPPLVDFSPFESKWNENSLWTLVLTNLDGHFTDENSEYLHWMVGNIKGNDFSSGEVICPYLQPFPPKGTGYHRLVFVLYKQDTVQDFSSYKPTSEKILLSERTFKSKDFFESFNGQVKPAGLAFFQSTYDSSLMSFFHNVLEMREPRFEYNFIPEYFKPWLREVEKQPFNLFLDKMRDPKEIQEDVLKKRLKTLHPFKGDTERHLKYPNAHGPQVHRYQDEDVHGKWRLREIERERLRQGYYKDIDWVQPRMDPPHP